MTGNLSAPIRAFGATQRERPLVAARRPALQCGSPQRLGRRRSGQGRSGRSGWCDRSGRSGGGSIRAIRPGRGLGRMTPAQLRSCCAGRAEACSGQI